MGYFVDNKITYDNLVMLYDKILVERVDIHKDELIKRVDDNTMVGKVLKVGTNTFNKEWKSHIGGKDKVDIKSMMNKFKDSVDKMNDIIR